MNTPVLEHLNDQIPFFHFVYENEGNTLGVLTQKTRGPPLSHIAGTGPCGMGTSPCLRAIIATALLVKTTKKISVGFS